MDILAVRASLGLSRSLTRRLSKRDYARFPVSEDEDLFFVRGDANSTRKLDCLQTVTHDEANAMNWEEIALTPRGKVSGGLGYSTLREWRHKNLDHYQRSLREQHLKRKFGLSMDKYKEMLETQDGVCAICSSLCDTGNNLAVDHDHVTGVIRMLLCQRCNTVLGLVQEDVELLSRLARYLEIMRRNQCQTINES